MACGCKNKQNGGNNTVVKPSNPLTTTEATPEKSGNRIIKREIK